MQKYAQALFTFAVDNTGMKNNDTGDLAKEANPAGCEK